ncbi:MAG TPA: 5-(carboxyamino)imidazole ribonucleotide mutase [Exilispira sp.]|nr:5-(carboxyamino)imidazole ribonucleotide mutase [Exilispira sp.]
MVDNAKANPIVSVVMGSDSDLSVMQEAIQMLSYFDIPYEIDIVSAHRTPDKLFQFAKNADKRGIRVIIAGAGGAAHLPGMIAAISALPVIGVPIKSSNSIDGWDSILSILQMPNGVPVATVALNAAKNAGILATQIIAVSDINLLNKVKEYKENLRDEVLIKGSSLSNDQNKHNS